MKDNKNKTAGKNRKLSSSETTIGNITMLRVDSMLQVVTMLLDLKMLLVE